MLGSGDREFALDRDRFRNGLGGFLEGLVEILELVSQTVAAGDELVQSVQGGIACIAEQLIQSVLVRLDYLLVVFVGFKIGAAPFRGILVEVLVPELIQGGVVFFLGDLFGFQLELQLGFSIGVCLFPCRSGFLDRIFFLLFGFLVSLFLRFELLLVCLFLILGQLIAVFLDLDGGVIPLVGINGRVEIFVPERLKSAVVGSSVDLAEIVLLFELVPCGLEFFLLGFDVDEVTGFGSFGI